MQVDTADILKEYDFSSPLSNPPPPRNRETYHLGRERFPRVRGIRLSVFALTSLRCCVLAGSATASVGRRERRRDAEGEDDVKPTS